LNFIALFYVEQNYAFSILRPLQTEIQSRGGSVHWLLVGDEIDTSLLKSDENRLSDITEAVALNASAVFVPGDRVPAFIPGLKVQVFHGLNEDKRGNIYPERGLFDLYCTEGPGRTSMLQPLAQQRGYFRVQETGWLKLDSLFSHRPDLTGENDAQASSQSNRPTILLASTFSRKLSGAEELYPEIKRLSELGHWQWLITLHPKMAADTVAKYRSLEGPNLRYFENDQVIDALHRADIMVSDNSSILQEFLLLRKPVVTFRNRAPLACMLDIDDPSLLQATIEQALNAEPSLQQAVNEYGATITPFLDGQSAGRVFQATLDMIESNWQDKKPSNFWRNWKMRRQFGYFKLIWK